MGKYSEVFVGIDTAKKKHAVAIADAGRDGETRYLGEIDSAPATVERVIKKLASKYELGGGLKRGPVRTLSGFEIPWNLLEYTMLTGRAVGSRRRISQPSD
jgi:hypothetical protein